MTSASMLRPAIVAPELIMPAANLNAVKADSEFANPMERQHVDMPAKPTKATFLRPRLSATQPQNMPVALPKKYAHSSILRKNDTFILIQPVADGTRTMTCVERDDDMIASARNSK